MASSFSPQPVHLLTCVHGMWGQPAHLERLVEVMQETWHRTEDDVGVELNVLVAETNRESHTYDGVDWGAERVVQEIKDRIKSIEGEYAGGRKKKVTKFSIVGYSLGGLLARYAVGILYSHAFFDAVTPVNFATIATPNIGLLKYTSSLWSRMAFTLGPFLLLRTGKHFYARDEEWRDGKPLLEVMSEKGGVFYDALAKFAHVTFYANAINDLTVPFVTAAFEPYDPFVAYPRTGVDIELDEKYAPVIQNYTFSAQAVPPPLPKPVIFSPKWWKLKYSQPSKLPPPLQVRAPFNILVWLLVPFLLPLLLNTVVGVFVYNAVRSGRRIKLLESSGKGNRSAMMNLMRTIEKGVEDAVVEIMDDRAVDGDPHPDAGPSNVTTPSRATTPIPRPALQMTTTTRPTPPKPTPRQSSITYTPLADPNSPFNSNTAPSASSLSEKQNQPALSAAQLRMIVNLNTLPNMRKVFVFLDGMRNAHATIVCRDLKGFAFHKRGEGVLRHLADHFEP